MIRDFDDLEVYQLSFELADWIYDLTEKFPADEKYNLVSQLRRASTSIGANIAEGYGRYHYKENQQFCRQARGSLAECKHFILFAHKRNYIATNEQDKFTAEYTKLKIKLNTELLRNAPFVILNGAKRSEESQVLCGFEGMRFFG